MLNPCEEEFQNVSGRNLAVGAAQNQEEIQKNQEEIQKEIQEKI